MSLTIARATMVCALTATFVIPAAIAAEGFAPGTRPDVHRFHYTSPYTGLEYDYDTRGGEPGGEVTAFRLSEETGDLTGRILVGEVLSRIVLSHDKSGLRSVVDYVRAEAPGLGDVHLSFPERDEDAYFKADETTADGIAVVSGNGPDCATLLSTGLHLSVEAAIRDLAADIDLSPLPPAHLQQISAAVFVFRSLVDRVDGCRRGQDPAAGRCHLDYDDFGGCSRCCEDEAALLSAICKIGSRALCLGPWCRMLRQIFCGGLTEIHEDTCASVMCNGKPGDPNCPPGQMCGEIRGSSCWEFCGITRRSVCGLCPIGMACCAPM